MLEALLSLLLFEMHRSWDMRENVVLEDAERHDWDCVGSVATTHQCWLESLEQRARTLETKGQRPRSWASPYNIPRLRVR